MDPMTIIVSVGFGIVGALALLTVVVFRKALRRDVVRRATASAVVAGDGAVLADLQRQRARMMRALEDRDRRVTVPVRPPVVEPSTVEIGAGLPSAA